jgi:competence protein ComEA
VNITLESSFVRTHGRRALALMALVALVATVTLIVAGSGSARAEPEVRAEVQVASPPAAKARPYWKLQPLAAPAPIVTGATEVAEAPAPAPKKAGSLRGVLNLNTADEKQLRLLPGVGAAKARRILQHREERGNFQRVDDLRKVKGFGKKSVEKLEPYLTVDGPTTLERA